MTPEEAEALIQRIPELQPSRLLRHCFQGTSLVPVADKNEAEVQCLLISDLRGADYIFETLLDTHASAVQHHNLVLGPTEAFTIRFSIISRIRSNVRPIPDCRDLGGVYLQVLH